MAYINSRLPANVSFGSTMGMKFQTDVIEYGNGKEYINSRWSDYKAVFDQQYIAKNRAEAVAVKEFFLACRGRANTFRVKDYLDYTSSDDGSSTPTGLDQEIGTGDGIITTFQLSKTYAKALLPYTRFITKPLTGSILVAKDSVLTTAFTIDYTTGILTFTSPPSIGEVITAGFEFDYHCRFNSDEVADIEPVMLFDNNGSAKDYFTIPRLSLIEVF